MTLRTSLLPFEQSNPDLARMFAALFVILHVENAPETLVGGPPEGVASATKEAGNGGHLYTQKRGL